MNTVCVWCGAHDTLRAVANGWERCVICQGEQCPRTGAATREALPLPTVYIERAPSEPLTAEAWAIKREVEAWLEVARSKRSTLDAFI